MSESESVRETQINPVAGVWVCDNCGRRIQVITSSEVPKQQSFICVCASEMRPGDEHVVVGESGDEDVTQKNVVDD